MSLIHGLHKDTLLEINGKLTPISNISIGDVRPSTGIASPSLPFSTKDKGFDLTNVKLPELWNGLADNSVT